MISGALLLSRIKTYVAESKPVRFLRKGFNRLPILKFRISRSWLGRWFSRLASSIHFQLKRFLFSRKESSGELVRSGRILTQIAKVVVLPAAIVALFTAVLLWIPGAWANPGDWMYSEPAGDVYIAVLTTVAASSGAFLALYFASMSVVASTAYAHVAQSIRQLVLHDKVSKLYLSVIAHAGAVSAFGLGALAIEFNRSILLLLYCAALLVIMLLAFFDLGCRIFVFFDPDRIASRPLKDLEAAIIQATPQSPRWRDPAFQNHARKRAERAMNLISSLLEHASEETVRRPRVVTNILLSVISAIDSCCSVKNQIPSDSLWFPKRPRFHRWDLQSSAATEIALSSGTTPQPEHASDHFFVESWAADLLSTHLKGLIRQNNIDHAITLTVALNSLGDSFARNLQDDGFNQILSRYRESLLSGLSAKSKEELESPKLSHLCEACCVASLGPVLISTQELSCRDIEELLDVHGSILDRSAKRLFKSGHPRLVTQALGNLKRRVEFELDVEGTVQTRGWYSRQIAVTGYADYIQSCIRRIVQVVEVEFLLPTKDLVDLNYTRGAAIWLHRAIEACQKAETQVRQLITLHEKLKSKFTLGIEWENHGGADALVQIESLQATAIKYLADMGPQLEQLPWDEGMPDFLGNSRAVIAEHIIERMDRQDETGFKDLFSATFRASLATHDQLMKESSKPGKLHLHRNAMDVLLETLSLSGLALLYSELDGTSFGQSVVSVWDEKLNTSDDPKWFVSYCFSVMKEKGSLPVFSPSSTRRHDWMRRFIASMDERGLESQQYSVGGISTRSAIVHSSDVIAAIHVHIGHMFQTLHGAFGVLYLAKLPCASGIDIPRDVDAWRRAIENVKKRREQDDA